MIDAASGGAFMKKSENDAYDLLEEMALNDQQWPNARNGIRRVAGINKNGLLSKMAAQIDLMNQKLEEMSMNA